jgi:hypothetical protein
VIVRFEVLCANIAFLLLVERTKLLTQLRERAVEIGEHGIRFLGMDPQQLSLVLEFASNIKNGTTDLPLNDRSKELMSQIAALKSESEVDKVTIERCDIYLQYFQTSPSIELIL